ncbi:MAG: fibronectin type III domain-containing protein, partial [Acidimicrobiia bacterium]|nr:fibronectin type III domain-containing protein [Acidimicrobiia bacterium]
MGALLVVAVGAPVLALSAAVVLPGAVLAQSASVVEVPADWALVPAGVGPGGAFRLLFRTRLATTAESSDIAAYDGFVQGEARTGHAAVRGHASEFRAVGSTASVDARDHVGMNPNNGDHLDVPVWWLNGPLAAAGSAGFWSDSWAAAARTDCRDESGNYLASCDTNSALLWTGTNTDGTKHSNPLGGGLVRAGRFKSSQSFSAATVNSFASYGMLAVSAVFRVAFPPPAVTASYTQVYEGERKVIVFEAPALSVDFEVSHLGGLTSADYRVFSPPDAAAPVSGMSWKAAASGGLVSFGLEGRSDGASGESGEALRVTLSSGGEALGAADVKIRDGERPASLLFRVRRGSPGVWVETDRPAVTLHEGGADVSYQVKLSKGAPGYAKTGVHIGPNVRNLTSVSKLRPGSDDGDRFIFRSPGPHAHGNSTSLIVGPGDGEGAWKTVTFAAGQDDDAFGHGLTLYHRASPGDMSYNIRAADEAPEFPYYEKPEVVDPWLLVNPDSRSYTQEKTGGPRAPGCPRLPGNFVCWTWPIAVRIVDDDRWEQELVFARHDAGADAPDGNWVRASDDGLRKALPAVLAPGSTYTFHVRLAKDPATLPKNGSVQRNVAVTEGGVTRRVDIYPPTFLPPSVFVGASVEGRNNDKGRPDVRLEVSPDGGRQWGASGAYFITDTSGQRGHPSVEADYDYRDNTPPGAKGSRLFWDEPLAVTVTVSGETELGVSRSLRVRTSWGIHSRPGARQGWSFDARLPIRIGVVEDLRPVGQRSEAGFSPRTPEEILEYVKQLNNDGEDAPFVPFADVTVEREEMMEGETARFTVTLTPAPREPRAVRLNVARREGSTPIGVGPQLGARTVMVGPSGSARFEIPTADNDDLGENGYLYVAVVSSPTYRVSVFGGVAETDVLSDDIEHFTDSVRVRSVTDSAATIAWDPQPGAASYEVIVLEGRGTEPRTSFTAGASIELTGLKANTDYDVAVLDDLWNRVGSVELRTLAPGGGEHRYPLLTVTGGGDITEGGAASFTVTATPA